jgi:hypothetical protein
MDSFGFRLFVYATLSVLACIVVGSVAEGLQGTCDPNDPEVTECDLEGVAFILGAMATAVCCVVAALVSELVLAVRRAGRSRRERPPART